MQGDYGKARRSPRNGAQGRQWSHAEGLQEHAEICQYPQLETKQDR